MSNRITGVTRSAGEYLVAIRSYLDQDEILEARRLVEEATSAYPNDHDLARIKNVLAPPRVVNAGTLDSDRTLEFEWLRQHQEEFKGRWVAVSRAGLVASAGTLKELLQALKNGTFSPRPLIHHVR